jgi:hypothetical protein
LLVRVLLLAYDCNPEWPSLPIVGYNTCRTIADHADVTLATHVRNRKNIERSVGLGSRPGRLHRQRVHRRPHVPHE